MLVSNPGLTGTVCGLVAIYFWGCSLPRNPPAKTSRAKVTGSAKDSASKSLDASKGQHCSIDRAFSDHRFAYDLMISAPKQVQDDMNELLHKKRGRTGVGVDPMQLVMLNAQLETCDDAHPFAEISYAAVNKTDSVRGEGAPPAAGERLAFQLENDRCFGETLQVHDRKVVLGARSYTTVSRHVDSGRENCLLQMRYHRTNDDVLMHEVIATRIKYYTGRLDGRARFSTASLVLGIPADDWPYLKSMVIEIADSFQVDWDLRLEGKIRQ